jgi:hypothetical protein
VQFWRADIEIMVPVQPVVLPAPRNRRSARGTKICIGHGRSSVWRDLKDFIVDRLNLP